MSDKKITPEELYKKLNNNEKVVILDVRAEEKFQQYNIEHPMADTVNLPKTNILGTDHQVSVLPEAKEIVVACTTGNSAQKCADVLSGQKVNAIVLEGGITAWKEFLKKI
ncbi:rhodanese-like domain-containing protein [Neobacillus terrae]|uniref:rhodanese-like domain-containing protein n=1 Tax=Neobacillus terrae TaxID=3034837 RepID=UPI0014073FD7|nr:rhodanese-like domain-containing protein [Neobacillus terrae]NHM31576.1 rhodanese-like domain-containing protein [Neobacillus terrae]